MSQPIIQTRITPPKLPKNILTRPRLVKLLDQNKDKSLILICSKAGSGKTTLIQDFLQQTGLKTAWLSVAVDMSDFYSFMEFLTYSLKCICDKFGTNTLNIIESVRQNTEPSGNISEVIVTVAGTFINEIHNTFKTDIYLVVDDLHNIDNEQNETWLNETFNFLLENIPANLHLIILTRQQPSFNLSRLSAKRKIFEIKEKALNFNEIEIEELLENIYAFEYSSKGLKILRDYRFINGWITGIHLILQAYGEEFYRAEIFGGTIPENIFNFFAEEIFENLEVEIQNFLLETALLENFNAEISNQLLNINKSTEIISQLINKNIFIQQTETAFSPDALSGYADYYSYQTLFQNFLTTKLHKLKPEPEINDILRKISDYYATHGDKISAIKYSLKAKDYGTAMIYLVNAAGKLLEQGKFQIVWNWLNLIPEEEILDNPHVSYFKATIDRITGGSLEKSLFYLNNAIRLFKDLKDLQLMIECEINKADILLLLGKSEDALSELQELLNLEKSSENEAKLYHNMARVYYSNSKYDVAVEYLNNSLKLCSSESLKLLHDKNLQLLGSIYLIRGEFIKSIYYYEQIAEESTDIYRKFRILSTIIFLSSYSGNYDKAKGYLDNAYNLLDVFPVAIYELELYYADAKLRNIVGDYEESNAILGKVITTANKIQRNYYLYFCYVLLAENHYYLNDFDKATQYLELCEQYLDKNNEEQNTGYNSLKAILNKKIKPEGDIEKTLLDALEYYKSNNLSSETVQSEFHLADYYLKKGSSDTAITYLEDSLRIGSERQYISIFENKVFDCRELFELAINKNIYKEFTQNIILNILHREEIKWLSKKCKHRLKIQIENFHDINMTSFGELSFKVRGKPVEEKLWTRKKSKVMLAYLILNLEIKLTKDKAVDLFFPELPMDKAEPLFHNAITNIRNALGSKRNIVIYEDKILRLNSDLYYKSDAEEFNRLYKLAFSTHTSDDEKLDYLEKAREIYKGDFLTGVNETWCEEMRKEFEYRHSEISNISKSSP